MLIALLAVQAMTSTPVYEDGWRIYQDFSYGSPLCVMEQPQRDNTMIRLILAPGNPHLIFVRLENVSWSSVRQGQNYALNGSIGNLAFQANATGLNHGVQVSFNKDEFLNRFYEGHRLIVNREGHQIINMAWRARRASDLLVQCLAGSSDPFRS